MKLLKKWWFWLIIVLFVLVNLWVSNDQQHPSPNEPQLDHSNIKTH